MTRSERVAVRVPGSIGNVGPGLDILGLAVDGAWDTVTMAWSDKPGIIITDPGHHELPVDPERNTAAIAAAAVLAARGIERGISIAIEKGLPISGGQGGSAASAVGGAAAAALLVGGMSNEEILAAALIAEATVAGRHLDNLAPSLLGGLVLCRSIDPIRVTRLPLPSNLVITLVTPHQQLRTRDSRQVLPENVARDVALRQAANVAGMVAGAMNDDLQLFGESLVDLIAEPARAPLLPGFLEAKEQALQAGAVACSISGSGPTAFALSSDPETAHGVGLAMIEAYNRTGFDARMRIAVPDRRGATPL